MRRYIANEVGDLVESPDGYLVYYDEVCEDIKRLHYLMRMITGKGNTSKTRAEACRLLVKYKEKK